MAGLATIDTKFFYGVASGSSGELTWTEIDNVLEIPSLGGSPEKIDVTVLRDHYRHYVPGVKDLGDLAFKFIYDNAGSSSNYRTLKSLEGQKTPFRVELPDALTTGTGTHHGTQFDFEGIPSSAIDGGSVNNAWTFTTNVALQSDITITDPA